MPAVKDIARHAPAGANASMPTTDASFPAASAAVDTSP